MKNKNKILAILIFLATIFIVSQVLEPVSASSWKVIDKGVAPHKNDKSVNVNWTATAYKNKNLVVLKRYSKNNTLYEIEKSTFNRLSNGKLKVSTIVRNNKNKTETNKFMKIKNSQSLTSYYHNIHKPKILKSVVTNKKLDEGWGFLVNTTYKYFNWEVYIYYNGKVLIKEEGNDFSSKGYVKRVIIEKVGKDKLKIITKNDLTRYDTKKNEYVVSSTSNKTTYTKSTLSPKNYYLNVYRLNMLKNLNPLRHVEIFEGNISNSSEKLISTFNYYWDGYDEKVEIISNYPCSRMNTTLSIEWFNKTTLKITSFSPETCSGGRSDDGHMHPTAISIKVNYMDFSLPIGTYFREIHMEELKKICDELFRIKLILLGP